jgi:hypothetical protein
MITAFIMSKIVLGQGADTPGYAFRHHILTKGALVRLLATTVRCAISKGRLSATSDDTGLASISPTVLNT